MAMSAQVGDSTRTTDAPSAADDNSTTLSDDEGGTTPTPEEQQAYNDFVIAGTKLIYIQGPDGKGTVNPGVVKLLDDDPKDLVAILGPTVGQGFNPVIALAATATIICLEVVQQAPQKPDGEIILHGGKEILEDLANLARQAGIHDYSQDEVNQAMLHAVNLYRVTAEQAGMVDTQALSAEFADILNAQEKGDINKLLPGIDHYAGKGIDGAQAAPTRGAGGAQPDPNAVAANG